jgi:ATP-binding cassette subfamily F protein uup
MLLGLKNVDLRIGLSVLLDQVSFSLLSRERVALLGRNGQGKSTLLRILSGRQKPDDGEVIRADALVVRCLDQEVPAGQDKRVFDVVAEGLGESGQLLAQYHHALAETPDDLDAIANLQTRIDEAGAWNLDNRVTSTMTRLKLDGEQLFGSLSGGMKRRVMLGQALVADPDVLLLDEPTNHLDIPSITMLEDLLLGFRGAVLFISHDRSFMRRMATRVCDLDRGRLMSWSNGYEGYLKGKEEFLHAEEKANALFDKRLAQEEIWIRRGVEARRTRNQGRVKQLMDMRREFGDRRNQIGQANMQVQEAERSGRLVAEIKSVGHTWGEQTVLAGFDALIMRGEKIAIIGPNGSGKTTLLQIVLKQLEPQTGEVRHGTRLEVAYFDQLRKPDGEGVTAVDVIGDGKEYIEIGGQPRHVIGYLQDFLFTPDRARQPVRSLSGGERARLLLAQMFATPSNVLVLDEPTNDLDIETLDLLEERLIEYTGTVLLVSHDREFIDQIATRSWVLEGDGRMGDYVGGYSDWLRQRSIDPWADNGASGGKGSSTASSGASGAAGPVGATPVGAATPAMPPAAPPQPPRRKLSYKEQRELETLPALIEKLETEQAQLLARIGDTAFYSGDKAGILKTQTDMARVEAELTKAYARWEELEA